MSQPKSILNPGTGWTRMVSYNIWPIYLRYPHYREQGGPQGQSGPGDKDSVDYEPDSR
jgi:hypothetical protein